MLRISAANIMVLALAMAGAIACSGSSDGPAEVGGGGSAGEDPSGSAAATGGHDAASSGAGGRDGAGGSAAGSGGAGAGGADGGTGGSGAGGADGGTGGSGAGGADGGAGAGGTDGGTGGAGAGGADGGSGGSGTDCTEMGRITYTLARAPAPTAEQQSAYDRITSAMDEALSYYNCHTNIEKRLSVSYVPSVATADGNVNGSIRFGSDASMNYITAMHEIGHTLGVGSREFGALVRDGIFTGPKATSQLRAITGNPEDVVHADAQHFWPYGLNYTSEVKSTADLVNHCKIVVAIREDIGF
ncbi:uncharacterized protein SOCEGT47_059800 [Sorangium cellulosum]|uniref:PE-PGRS family protein n=1 Tax=Sorangium cellulosum TaxID=56 RepID=A0A4P2Q8P8_SORCE|nr:hypothetical protein [Sorangium cellulosum]AUX25433.1 uncharacterized protein SOCEGT47_059800 [Sorangium cellulosum]